MRMKPGLFSRPTIGHPLAKGLAVCLLMNEKDGSIVYDCSGNNNHGTITGATWASAKFGNGLSFDGNDYVTVPWNPPAASGTSFTIACWVNVTNYAADRGIFGSVEDKRFLVWMDNASPDHFAMAVSHENVAYTSAMIAYGSVIPTGGWWHIVFVMDNTTNIAKLYVNGNLDATLSGQNLYGMTNGIYFGNSIAGTNKYLTGIEDNGMGWNRALSASEIMWLYRDPFVMFEEDM